MRALFVIACLLVAAVARADFDALDRNRDGYVSRIEASADKEVAARFDQFDLDGDGRLSLPEYDLLVQDNEKRASREALFAPREKNVPQAEKKAPSLAITVATPAEAGAISSIAPTIPQTGMSLRFGVQWLF